MIKWNLATWISPSASSSVERGLEWWPSICHSPRLGARNGPEEDDDDEDDADDDDKDDDNHDDEEEDEDDGCNDNPYLKIFYICMKDEVKVNEYHPVGGVKWKYLLDMLCSFFYLSSWRNFLW